MKKLFILAGLVLSATLFTCIYSCSSDDESAPTTPALQEKYLTIEDAIYQSGSMPTATTEEELEGVEMSSQAMSGAMNYITIITQQEVQKFYVAIDGVDGYYEFNPNTVSLETNSMAARATSSGYNTYTIPVMISNNFTDDCSLLLSALLKDNNITSPIKKEISLLETQEGALEIKLAFSNNKDIDLHLYTPNGTHIYYGNRGGAVILENGDTISYGLDIDSNAACNIDGINKENIYISEELIEAGEYTVEVNMYENCDRTIATDWSIVTRYQGQVFTPTTGKNPAVGVYPINAGVDDHTEVMKFTIHEASNSPVKMMKRIKRIIPIQPTDIDLLKMEDESFRK